jgi:hypothetical protein
MIRFSKKTAENLLRCLTEMSMTPHTFVLYIYYFAHNGEPTNRMDIKRETGLGYRTIKIHTDVLKLHGILQLSDPEGKEHKRKIIMNDMHSPTLPSTLHSIHSIIDIPSQKTNARRAILNSKGIYKEEEDVGLRVGSDSPEPDKLKKSAQRRVRKALKLGELVKPDKCAVCGRITDRIEAVHDSYEEHRWLDIVWMCRSCKSADARQPKITGKFTVSDILRDDDWKRAESSLKQFFKPFEYSPSSLTRKKRFQFLIEILNDEDFDFQAYCSWYSREKYDEKGFNFGFFLYPGLIAEFRDSQKKEGVYLKTTTKFQKSESHKNTMKTTKAFLRKLRESEE